MTEARTMNCRMGGGLIILVGIGLSLLQPAQTALSQGGGIVPDGLDGGPVQEADIVPSVIVKLHEGVTLEHPRRGSPFFSSDKPGRHRGFDRQSRQLNRVMTTVGLDRVSPALIHQPADRDLANRFGLDRYIRFDIPEGMDPIDVGMFLSPFDHVFESVEVDGIGMIADDLPADPHFQSQYGFHNTGQVQGGEPGLAGADINAVEGWSITTGSDDILIAILDSGINSHVDLAGRIDFGWNIPDNDGDTSDECSNHGTHVAGLAAAAGDNGLGIAGVAWNVRILPVVVVDGCQGVESWAADGLVYATDAGADVINMSLQYYTGTSLLRDALLYAVSSDIPVVAAAGNIDAGVAYPAKWAESVAVAATDHVDQKWWASNFGNEIDVAAAGSDVISLSGTDSVQVKSGTSMAAPLVSGTFALMRSMNNDLSYALGRSILQSTAIDIGPAGFDIEFGFGRIDLAACLQAVQETLPSPADLNVDGVVDGLDLGILLGQWGPCGSCDPTTCPADIDGDCTVSGTDLGILLAEWSAGKPA